MHQKLLLPILIAIVVIGLCITRYYSFLYENIPTVMNTEKELHLPAPFNASLGFAKIFFVSLPE